MQLLRNATNGSGRERRLASLFVAAVLAVTSLPITASPAAAGDDPFGEELMRLTNLDRTALGYSSLAIDPELVAFARNLTFTCPTKSTMAVRGRAQDGADRNYFAHTVPGCYKSDGTLYGSLDIMYSVLKYHTNRAENIARNTYPTSVVTTKIGCSSSWTNCKGSTTTPETVAVAQKGFMTSSAHRTNLLGAYDRFGCGHALATDGKQYYSCLFSKGGPDLTAPTMTKVSAPSVVASATGTVKASWAATDNRGVTGYQYKSRKGAAGTWTAHSATTTALSHTFSYPGAGTFYVAVRARDAAGNWSAWRETSSVVPKDDRSFSFSSGMTRTTSTTWYRGTLTNTKTAGSTATVSFTGVSFAMVAKTSVYGGKVQVTVDGVPTTVDLGYYKGVRETTTHARVVVFKQALTAGVHSVTVTCLGTSGRPTVNIDGIGWHD